MRRSDLGVFGEVLLQAVAVLTPQAYTMAIAEELEEETARPRRCSAGVS